MRVLELKRLENTCVHVELLILKTEERETKIDEQHRTYGVG